MVTYTYVCKRERIRECAGKGGTTMYDTFLKLAEERYSVRKYDSKPIKQEKLDRILRAGQVAPTAANAQP